jgi:beta-lactamase regulating signal transducer with metallopeptidase domain
MRIGGLVLLMVMVSGAVFGMYAMMTMLNLAPITDSEGKVVNQSINLTQQNVTAIAKVAPRAGIFVALIIAVIVLAAVVVYFAAATRGRRGRY